MCRNTQKKKKCVRCKKHKREKKKSAQRRFCRQFDCQAGKTCVVTTVIRATRPLEECLHKNQHTQHNDSNSTSATPRSLSPRLGSGNFRPSRNAADLFDVLERSKAKDPLQGCALEQLKLTEPNQDRLEESPYRPGTVIYYFPNPVTVGGTRTGRQVQRSHRPEAKARVREKATSKRKSRETACNVSAGNS